jgi:hypothetical protein
MYEMEGPRPASPHRLVSCLAPADAARRPPGPGTRSRTGLPVPPAFPGLPRVVPFPTANLSTADAAAAQEPVGAISGFFRDPRMNLPKPPNYPHFIVVIHGLIHSLSTGQGWEPGNAGIADTGCNRLIFPTGLNVITRAMGDWRCGTDGRP